MGKEMPTPPPAPNPVAIAGAQGAENRNSAISSQILNQTNQVTPYGSVMYDQPWTFTAPDGTETPWFRQTTTLSPDQQKILDQSEVLQQSALGAGEKAIGNVTKTISNPFDLKGLPSAPGSISTPDSVKSFNNPSQQMSLGINDFSADRQKVEDALMSRFNQDWDKQQASTTANLNAQGLQAGSEAYGVEMDQLNRARNDAKTQAILGAGQEQSRLFGMTKDAGMFANDAASQQFAQNQSAAGFRNAAQNQDFAQDLGAANYAQGNRQQALSEYALQRSQPINEFATLFGLGGGVQVPGGAPQTGVGVNPADILGANALQYQVLNNNYSQQMQNRNARLGALGSIGGMAGAALL